MKKNINDKKGKENFEKSVDKNLLCLIIYFCYFSSLFPLKLNKEKIIFLSLSSIKTVSYSLAVWNMRDK